MTSCLALLTDAYGGHGGIAQYNRDFTSAMAEHQGLSCIEILPRTSAEPQAEPPAKIRQHPPIASRLGYIHAAWKAASRLRPDIIYCGHASLAILAAVLAWRVSAKLIVQAHGIEIWPRPAPYARRAIERADLILCVSRFTRAQVLAWADIAPERVKVVPCMVSPVYEPGDGAPMRKQLGLGDAFVLLTVGRLDKREAYKGHDRVIAHLADLQLEDREVVYLIVGDGEDRGRLEALAKSCGVADKVRFLGRVSHADLPSIYRASDLFVMPSTGEGFGIVFLEAMACGTPALGLATAGATDPLSDGELGMLADEQGFAAALQTAAAAVGDRAELARKVRQRFGREAFRANLHHALDRMLNPNGAPVAGKTDSLVPKGTRQGIARDTSRDPHRIFTAANVEPTKALIGPQAE